MALFIKPIDFSKIAQVKTLVNLCSRYVQPMTMKDIKWFDDNPYTTVITAYDQEKCKVHGVAIYEDVNPRFRQLLYVGVHPGYRNKGIGSKLFQHTLHMEKPIKCIIPTRDTDLNNWLRQRGFKAEILWRDFWQHDEVSHDAVCMRF